jgi:predicted enzyme related to lactoylglutathione lyase
MGQPVVHFEVIGKDPEKLRSYFADLFGWEFDTSAPVPEAISQPANYGFVDRNTTGDGIEAALRKAEGLGGTRRLGPVRTPGKDLVVGHFADPEGHLIGVAGTA